MTETTTVSGFEALNLIAPILKNLHDLEYLTPTPIQTRAIPYLLEGRDLLACAQTGTGKTAAFAIPLLQKLFSNNSEKEKTTRFKRPIKALILSPTRELASQIGDSFRTYGRSLGLTQTVVFGGVSYRTQIQAVARGVDILVATPGRLLDLMKQGIISLREVETFILDEADQMFDMGFSKAVQLIVSELPKERQTILFSATMPPSIEKLADAVLRNPERLIISPISSSCDKIKQQILFVDRRNKPGALNAMMQDKTLKRAIVFSRTKHGADRIVEQLTAQNVNSEAIHGDKKQAVRRRILDNFKRGHFDVLVATDVAARGIDIDGITHVINYDLPHIPENYVHRIGRTGRAGASGTAISFCDHEEKAYLRSIERLTKNPLLVVKNSDMGLPETSSAPQKWSSSDKKPPFKKRGDSSEFRSSFSSKKGGGSGSGSSFSKNGGGGGRSPSKFSKPLSVSRKAKV